MTDAVKAAAAKFPKTFGLRAFPGDKFTINESASYESPFGSGNVLLYTYTVPADGSEGLAFCKGSPSEIRREIVA
jgi:hypothetical protein